MCGCMDVESVDDLFYDFSRFYILTILYEGPTHGYGVLNKFKKRLGKKITPSIVYPFLKKLEDKEIVTYKIKPVGRKNRKIYELTPEGRKLCSRLFKRFASLVSTAIEPSMETCAHCGCKIYKGGYAETIDGMETIFCCKHSAGSYRQENIELEKTL